MKNREEEEETRSAGDTWGMGEGRGRESGRGRHGTVLFDWLLALPGGRSRKLLLEAQSGGIANA